MPPNPLNPGQDFLPQALANGALVATDSLRLSSLGADLMSGQGVFETVRVRNGQPVWLAAHLARLGRALVWLEPHAHHSLPPSPGLAERCGTLIAANGQCEGSLKIILFQEADHWSEVILARPFSYSPTQYRAGFRLRTMTCDPRVSPHHALKLLDQRQNLQARATARAAGCDEALWVDSRGQVLEGAATNLFLVRDGIVSTPPLAADGTNAILPGVMRAAVLQLPGGAPICERPITLDELRRADEVWVTNALLGIMPVTQVDETNYNLQSNPITRQFMAVL